MNVDRLFREKDVLKIVGVSRSTLYRWIQSNEFPAPVRIGPRTKVWPEDKLKHWIESKTNHLSPTKESTESERRYGPGVRQRKYERS